MQLSPSPKINVYMLKYESFISACDKRNAGLLASLGMGFEPYGSEDVESTEHLLCECDGLARKRLDLLGVAYPQPED
ncbi:jg17756 [Pararge aegeria aegeria]|uniref:Jg17756 protein n=1 Tax=Pararge aegeria aegeria TaxID=348720 RepID=A0A8S4RF14_9NEOP|nr:jg17756 [Pararge aegeria aegeria]